MENSDMQYKRGNSYLVLHEKINATYGIYLCKVCLSKTTLTHYKVSSGHDKTCGCMNGVKDIEYTITKEGNVQTNGGYFIQTKCAKGYRSFRGVYLHRLVAEKFIPNPLNLQDVNHIDGNKSNNNVNNLEWCTRSHNIKHAWENKLNKGQTGQDSPKRRFTENEINEILLSTLSSRKLALQYGVVKTTILNIRRNKGYA